MSTETTDLASTLAGIREHSETASKIMVSWKAQIQRARASANDVPFLLAAIEAVLALGDRSGEAQDPHLPGHVDVYMIREAITAELTGKPENGSAQAAATREDGGS